VRTRSGEDLGSMSVDDLARRLHADIASRGLNDLNEMED
jgi:hypothetical protein